jgi:hypothetical protein
MRNQKWLVAALVLVTAVAARASTIDVESTTLLNAAKQTRGGQPGQPFNLDDVATAFEIVSITARDVANPVATDLTFVLRTWAAYDIADHRWDNGTGSNLTGDLQTAYAEGRLIGRRLTLRLGRTQVATGVARMVHLDGGEAVLVLPAGFRVSGYVGAPVTQRFGTRSSLVSWNAVGGDLAAGGRVGWSLALPGAPGRGLDLGASYNTVQDGSDPVREEAGVDARLRLIDPLVLAAFGSYSLYDARVSEGVVRAAWTATRLVLVEADYRYVAPDLLLARNSILSVFSAEERQSIGGGATFRLARGLRAGATYHAIIEPTGEAGKTELGHEADARVEWERGPTVAGVEGFFLDAFDNGYVGGRLFGRRELGRAFAAADVLAHVFREKVNGEDLAFTGTLTLGYELLHGLSAVVSGRAGVTPFMEQTFEFMAKLAYNQTYRKTEVR